MYLYLHLSFFNDKALCIWHRIASSTVDTDGHSESDYDALGSHGSRTAAFPVHPKVNIFKMYY